MCSFCKKLKKDIKISDPLTDTDIQRIMKKIADFSKSEGTDPSHFDQLIDDILDTKLKERDRESEAIYQAKLHNEDG